MGGNPKDSEWRSTPREKRHRGELSVTISKEAREKLERAVTATGAARSAIVERLLLEMPDPPPVSWSQSAAAPRKPARKAPAPRK